MRVGGLMRDGVRQGSGIGVWRASLSRTRAVFPRAMRNCWRLLLGAVTAPACSGRCQIRTCGGEGTSMDTSYKTQWSKGRGKVASTKVAVEMKRRVSFWACLER